MSLTLQEALAEGCRRLAEAGIEESALESELFLRHILEAGIVDVYLRYDEKLTPQQRQAYFDLISRRIAGEPSAYITGQREFFGIPFYVNPSVLIPRPETELLVEKALEAASSLSKHHRSEEPPSSSGPLIETSVGTGSGNPVPSSQNSQLPTHDPPLVISDIGTGSGIIAVVLAKRLPGAKVYAVDISPDALATARRNARRHSVADRITFLEGSLVSILPKAADIIVGNLPYVKSSELPPTGEPRCALDGGSEGLDVIQKLLRQVPAKLKPGGVLLLEIGFGQREQVVRLVKDALPGAKVETFWDLSRIPRVIMASTTSKATEGV